MLLELELEPPLELPLLLPDVEEGDEAEFVPEGEDADVVDEDTNGFVSVEIEAADRSNVNWR